MAKPQLRHMAFYPSFGLGGNVNGPGNPAIPFLFLKSTANNPNNRTVTLVSTYPFIYHFYDSQGRFLKSAYPPAESTQAPYTIVVDFTNGFPNLTLPTTMNVDIQDAATTRTSNNQRIQVLGGDVFNVTVTYKDKGVVPGMQMMSVDGAHRLVRLSELNEVLLRSSDTHYGGNGQ